MWVQPLYFSNDLDILEEKSSENSYKTSAIYNTSASPFKVISPENRQIFTPTVHKKTVTSATTGTSNNGLYFYIIYIYYI